MIGSSLSHYRITAELGRGGMGIVFKGEDTKLDRTVAIKILPATTLSSDDDRARFYREAKAAAALHHPNIATIFEIDEAVPSDAPHGTQPSPFIAMEYVDGDSLKSEIDKGPMPLKNAVSIATQIADALKAAHEKSIVHRDIKGQNVMITEQGDPKVLDFGLAKTAQSTQLTRMGSTLGTAAYMSPEQARGEEVDQRTDIWSLGVVLYEMISGRLPFGGEYEKAVMYGILNEAQEPLTAIRAGVPMGLEWIVNKMLAKNSAERYQSCTDLIVDLKAVDLSPSAVSAASTMAMSSIAPSAGTPKSNERRTIPWKMVLPAAVLLVMLGVVFGIVLTPPDPVLTLPSQQFSLAIEDIQSIIYLEPSKDGKYLVFSGQDSTAGYQIYAYDVETKETRVLAENRGDRYRFSPDNSTLVYRDGTSIFTIPFIGGAPIEIGSFGSGWPVFLEDASIVLDRNESLWIHPSDGSEPKQISQVDSLAGEGGHYNAEPLPDGESLLFHITRTTGEGRQLSILSLKTGRHTLLGPGASPRYIASGHVIYVDGSSSASGQLLMRPFDIKTLSWTGRPIVLSEAAGVSDYAFDGFGTLYAMAGSSLLGQPNVGIFVAIDPVSGAENQLGMRGQFLNHRVSPDGTQISYAADVDGNGIGDYLAVYNRISGIQQRLTLNGDSNFSAWSADGENLYIEVDSKLEKWSNSSLRKLEDIATEGLVSSFDVSPDEQFVVYINHDNQGFGNVHLLDRSTGVERVIMTGPYHSPRFSRDGKYIAVSENLPVRIVVYSIETEAVTVATNDSELAEGAIWGIGSALFYQADPLILVRLPISLENGFRPTGRAEVVAHFSINFEMDMDSNGEVVLYTLPLAGPGPDVRSESFKIDVTTNWFDVAKKLAPRSN